MDFTLNKYKKMLLLLLDKGYKFITFEQYCDLIKSNNNKLSSFVILRHDVDLYADRSLKIAKIEYSLGITASYYFRVVPQSNQPKIICQIVELGHEIGYHYEDMALCKGNIKLAKVHFEQQLTYFRQFYPIKTICMHGVPKSSFDGRELWKNIDYKQFGVIGEPYFDCDFNNLFYITDTGRRWDGYKVSFRDKIPFHQERWNSLGWQYHSTEDIIVALKKNIFPLQLMMTTHPQRWTNNIFVWLLEFIIQPLKNCVKKILIQR